jgi:hypothetical protein
MKLKGLNGLLPVGLLGILLLVTACGDGVKISIELDEEAHNISDVQSQDGWKLLFDGATLDGWNVQNSNTWMVKDNALTVQGVGDIWTKKQFGDFVLECDFNISTKCNSGIYIRTGDTEDAVQTGLEIQLLDGAIKPKYRRNACGAIYDCLAPAQVVVKAAGEWNQTRITCCDNRITVVMNDVPIIDMDVNRWDTPGQNPDGTSNKFSRAIKDLPRSGFIGFRYQMKKQYQGHPVWLRNIRIKEL